MELSRNVPPVHSTCVGERNQLTLWFCIDVPFEKLQPDSMIHTHRMFIVLRCPVVPQADKARGNTSGRGNIGQQM